VRGIPRGEAHIWLVRPESAGDPGLLREYERLLDDGEKRQRDRLIPDEARHHQVVTRALVRTMLSTYTGIDPKRWLFATNAHGRPEILEPVECAHIRFNVSHTHGLIACIAADAREVGIDVEWADRAGRLVELAERFFSKKEADAIRALDGDAQRDRFFETWTLKESACRGSRSRSTATTRRSASTPAFRTSRRAGNSCFGGPTRPTPSPPRQGAKQASESRSRSGR